LLDLFKTVGRNITFVFNLHGLPYRLQQKKKNNLNLLIKILAWGNVLGYILLKPYILFTINAKQTQA